jgi:hypothetical protein
MKPNRGKNMVNHFNWIIRVALASIALVIGMPLDAAVRAELDRNRITEGETVMLTFLTDDPRQSLDTDFSALEKDFQVLDRRSETQLSIVNGRQTAVVRLLLTLEPKTAGEVVIPQLSFGSDKTRALTVKVDPAPELEPGSQPPVFIEVEILPADGPYFVHAQLGLVVRVFYQQNLTEAAISQPDPSPAVVRLMQETPYQAERGGERYRVLERNYAVFPERSGELTIPPMQLTGRLVERRTSSVWQPAVRGRRVQVESEAMVLKIEPKPAEFAGSEWQPAREYRLTQQISSGESLRVGEPVTRTVIVDAVGLEENMLVEPVWPEVENARIYPDQPQGITRDDGQWVLGHKEFRYAVVPEQEGQLVLPELRVEWWDTQNSRAQTAVLASQTIEVQPSALVPSPPQAPVAADPNSAVAGGPSAFAVAGEAGYWRWLALLFAVLWLLTLAAALLIRNRKKAPEEARRAAQLAARDEAGMLAAIEKTCKAGNRREVRRALLHWIHDYGPIEGRASLLEFAAGMNDPDIRDGLRALDAEGFRPQSGTGTEVSWNGPSFWKQFDSWRKAWLVAEKNRHTPVTDLYARENRSSG